MFLQIMVISIVFKIYEHFTAVMMASIKPIMNWHANKLVIYVKCRYRDHIVALIHLLRCTLIA